MFVMGVAAGLLRQRSEEDLNQAQSVPHSSQWWDFITFDKPNLVDWRKIVDLSSLLIIVALPLLGLLVHLLPLIPRLGLLVNVLFVLPQLLVIVGL